MAINTVGCVAMITLLGVLVAFGAGLVAVGEVVVEPNVCCGSGAVPSAAIALAGGAVATVKGPLCVAELIHVDAPTCTYHALVGEMSTVNGVLWTYIQPSLPAGT